MNTPINELLAAMPPVTLEGMTNLRLMDRRDCKYAASELLLPSLLEQMRSSFKVQVNAGTSISAYATQYFDTCDLKLFLMHQNGKLNRQKIRIRSYVDSNLSFLEIKNKNNKGRTSKQRIAVQRPNLSETDILPCEREFLDARALFGSEHLVSALSNRFHRLTFINNRATERVTIDIGLSFLNYRTGKEMAMERLMILELKQDGRQQSDFGDILIRARIKPTSFSKYCMGTILTDPDVKYNRFKSKWNTINKLIQ